MASADRTAQTPIEFRVGVRTSKTVSSGVRLLLSECDQLDVSPGA
jgi:hypothetical protein